jgi:DNA-binding transcriptional LysR family regulator
MELRQLRYFIVAGEEQHISRAARRLHITQPALSQQIRDLEAELGCALFERLPRGVRLSAAGQAFLERARAVLAELEDAAERSRHAGRGEVGRLRVGFNEIAAQQAVVAEAMRRYRERYPHVELDLAEMNTFQQLDAFRARALDIGFQYNQDQDRDTLRVHALRTDRYAIAMPAFHRLAKKKRLAASDLAGEPLVWLSRAVHPLIHDRLMAFFNAAGVVPRIVQESKSEASALNLVSVGMGLAPLVGVPRAGMSANIVLRPMAGLDFPLNFVMAWRAGDTSPLVANFVQTVQLLQAEGAPGRRQQPSQAARQQKQIRRLRGKLKWEGDLDKLRTDK